MGTLGTAASRLRRWKFPYAPVPRGTAPGLHESYLRGDFGVELTAVLQKAFTSAESPALPAGML